jgi:dTDP-4-amino-4,6-dideoxygalactose transaminase
MISVFGSDFTDREIEEVSNTIKQQWVGMGPASVKFETMLALRYEPSDVALVNSGSNALMLACKLLNLPVGSEVILPSLTWVACAHAIKLAGYKPVFCDVELETYNVSARTIEPHINKNTGAILVVHYAGLPVDMTPIVKLGYPVIEDAAHAIDSTLNGKRCGTIGNIGILSFDPVKNLSTCDAGAVLGNSDLIRKAKELRYCGIKKSGFESAETSNQFRWWEHEIVTAFPRIIPNDIAASFGLAQLERLKLMQKRRSEIWKIYQDHFSNIGGVFCPKDAKVGQTHSYFTYMIRINRGMRDDLAHYLYDAGIYTTFRYHPLHLTNYYKTKYHLQNTELLAEYGLNLPLHPRLTNLEVEQIARLVRKCITGAI